jgi:hypothetical protein
MIHIPRLSPFSIVGYDPPARVTSQRQTICGS